MRLAILSVLCAAVLASFAVPTVRSSEVESAYISITTADTAGTLLRIPRGGQTIVIRKLTIWYDNAANTNPAYIGIVTATAGQTRQLWLGDAMASSGISVNEYGPMYFRLTPTTAQAGVRLFISAASSDSLEAVAEYEVVND